MFTIVTEGKARASTSFCFGVYPVSIALATIDLNQVTLNLDLEGILLQLNERATTAVNRQGFGQCDNLSGTLGDITYSLATIHQVDMIGLDISSPFCSFLYCDHCAPVQRTGLMYCWVKTLPRTKFLAGCAQLAALSTSPTFH